MVLHYFYKDKSLRGYGSPVEFFFGFYALLEEDLLRVIEDSRNYGRILFNLNIVNWL